MCMRDEPCAAQALEMMDRQFHHLSALVENLHHIFSECVETGGCSLEALSRVPAA
jgi:hypothetical protein